MTSKGKRFYCAGLALAIFSIFFSSQTATMQNGETDSPPPVPAPAAGAQLQPQIAKGANSTLAVWTDRRTVLNRYVPSDSAGVGSGGDIYAARYDANGALLDAAAIMVSQAVYSQRAPHVGWNGQNWLVAWITERQSSPFAEDVHAVRVAPDGRVLDSAPIVIGVTPSNSSTSPSYLSVASDGTNWVVVWGTGTYSSQIRAARIQPDGTLVDTGGGGKVLFDDTNLFTAPGNVRLAFIGNQFLLVWDRITSGGHGIRAQRFNNNLDPVDAAPFVVNQFAGSDGTAPRVATDGANYFVIWREDRFAYNEIFGTRVSAAGQVLDLAGIKLFGSPGDFILNGNTSLAWDGTSYVAAYHARPVGTSGESVFASRVSADGTTSAPIPIATEGVAFQPAVAPLAGGGAQIVWTDERLSVDGDIFGAKLSAANTISQVGAASLGAPRETYPRLTKTAAGNFALAYRSTISGTSSIYLQRLNSSGNQIGEPTLVVSGAENIINPSVAWNGAVYLVTWELNGQTFGQRVAADGTNLGTQFLVSVGNTPDVAALGSQFLVVNSFPRTTQLRHTQATTVSGDGAVGAPVRIGNNFDLRPRVRAFGTRWLVVWESDISHDNPNSNIAAAFVNADGTAAGAEFSIGSFGDAPDFAVADNTALVVWMDGGNIIGRRLLSDGTFLSASAIVADTPSSLFAPKAAWDGARFVVTYGEARSFALKPPADIHATLVNLNGAIITPGGFPVADSVTPEEMPAVEAQNGVTLFGFAKFEDRQPFAAFRARIRRFPFDRDFSIALNPFSRTIAPGATTTYTINVAANNNFTGEVVLSVDGLPNGVTATFNPPTIAGSGSSTLTLTTSANTPENIYRFTISATSGAQQSTANAVLFLDDNPPPVGYAVTNLGTLGGTTSEARAINDSGQIVGYAFNANQKKRAFLYNGGALQDLGDFGGTESVAFDINNSGQVVGWAKNAAEREQAFSYNNSTLQNLGTLGGERSYAYGINNNGQMTGSAEIGSGLNHAFLYQNNAMQDLGVLGGFYSYGFGINNAGKLVGFSYQDGELAGTRAFIHHNGAFISLGTLGGRNSSARAINDSDKVVGSSDFTPDNGTQHAFLFQNGTMQDLGTLDAAQSYAYDINNAGKVVGSLRLTLFGSDYRAFLYDGSQMRNLNTLISQNSGWVLNEAFGINNIGQIVGRGTFNGQSRAFMLNPTASLNQPPTVEITSPTNNQNTGDSNLLTINATALDADGAVVRVEFYANGNLIGTSTSNPFAILWNAAPGTYTLTAKAFDDAGAATVSAPVTITISGTSAIRTRFDFDGDGKADVSVFRPSNGTWYLQNSSSGFSAATFGLSSDKLVPADYDGDGKTDVAVYRNGIWYLQRSQAGFTGIAFGASDDIPVPADFDGDGKAELAVFRPSNGGWYFYNLATNQSSATAFGQAGDKPVAADYDADGKADVAVFRQGTWYLQRSSLGFTGIAFGEATDKLVPADYDGDGKADVAVFRPSNGTWYLQRSQAGFTGIQFGLGTDAPTPADYDGDGKVDVAVFRNGIWYLQRSQAGFTGIQFGAASDLPIPFAHLP